MTTTTPAMMPDTTTRRFRTDQLPEIRHLLHAHPQQGDVGVRGAEPARLRETYVDTADGRFLRAGYSLAIRNQGDRTDVVLDPWATDNGRPSLQVRAPIPTTDLGTFVENCPEGVRDTLHAVIGRERLHEVLRLLVRRETYHLSREGEPLGSVTLVETLVYGDGNAQPTRHEHVEFDLIDDDDPTSFVSLLRKRFELRETDEAPVPELLRERTRRDKKKELGPLSFGARSATAEVAFAILRRHYLRALAHEPGARLGVDPDELRDLRVSMRRMRGALRLYREQLPDSARGFRKELRWLSDRLGDVRDLDLQIEWLRAESARRPLGELRALRDIEAALRRRRAAAREAMLEALDSDRYREFRRRFAKFLRRGPRKKPKAGRQRIRKVAPRLVGDAMKRVERRGRKIGTESTADELAALRRPVKRARYALEFHRPVYGALARDVITRIVTLQDLLDEYQAAQAFLERTARFFDDAEQPSGDDPLVALEALRQERLARAQELRALFPVVFRKACGKPWKRLLKAMDKKRR